MKRYSAYKDSGIEWIGEIPEGWGVKRLKYLLKSVESGSRESQEQEFNDVDKIPSIGGEHISWSGNIEFTDNKFVSKKYFLRLKKGKIKTGDVLLVKDGATIGKTAFVKNEINAAINEHVFILRTNNNFKDGLLYYNLVSDFTQDLINLFSRGAAQAGLPSDFVSNIFLLIPPEPEQTAIATFLDHKTAKIDELIKKNEGLIELLKEKRQAIISHAVTKGLDPNAKMKDSGIEWLREIPEKWEGRKLKHLTTEKFKNGIFKKKEFYGSGIKLINVFDVYRQDFYIEIESLDRIEVTSQEIQTYSVKAGDIVFVRSSLKLEGVGASACVPSLSEPLLFECHLVKLQPSSKILPEYLINFLNSSIVRQRLIALANTVTMATLGQSTLTSIEVELPPVFEQQAILIYLISETTKIDELINNILSQIAALKEYRQALISNVVTGKVR